MTLKVYQDKPKGFTPKITVVGCYCLCQDRVLLLKRSPQGYAGGTWCLPGGKKEVGESRLEGARREFQEECGVKLRSEDLSHWITLYLEIPDYQYDFSIYHYTFDVEPTLDIDSREHTEGDWFTYQEALKLPLIYSSTKVLEYCTALCR